MYVSTNRNIEPSMDILLLFNENLHHYVLINSLIKVVCTVMRKLYRNILSLYRNCFAFSHSQRNIKCTMMQFETKHQWQKRFPAMVKNFSVSKFFRLGGLLHFLCISTLSLIPVSSCPANLDASSTEVIQKHIPSGYALTSIENGFSTAKEFITDSCEKFMTDFLINYMRWRKEYTVQRDNFQCTWWNIYLIEVVQMSVSFVKNLLDTMT